MEMIAGTRGKAGGEEREEVGLLAQDDHPFTAG